MASHANNWSLNKIILVSAIAGIVVLLFLLWILDFAFWGSFLWGLIVGVIVFLILWLGFGGDSADAHGSSARAASSHGATASGASGAAAAESTSTGGSSGAATAASANAGATAADAGGTDGEDGAGASASDAGGSAGDDSAGDDGAGAGAGDSSTGASAAAASAGSSGAASASDVVKPSKALSGQDDLADRKGSWKYGESDGAASGADTSGGTSGDGASATAGGAGASAASGGDDAASTPDYDKDGVREGTDEGSKPAMLSGAREGGADNLKEIKGVGPKMEQMLNAMGVYHFDQVAGWSADEVAWVDANLKGFKGRVSRDGWVDQAKILAAGGETEFSARVDKGEVY